MSPRDVKAELERLRRVAAELDAGPCVEVRESHLFFLCCMAALGQQHEVLWQAHETMDDKFLALTLQQMDLLRTAVARAFSSPDIKSAMLYLTQMSAFILQDKFQKYLPASVTHIQPLTEGGGA